MDCQSDAVVAQPADVCALQVPHILQAVAPGGYVVVEGCKLLGPRLQMQKACWQLGLAVECS
jgi:hypothetical protein